MHMLICLSRSLHANVDDGNLSVVEYSNRKWRATKTTEPFRPYIVEWTGNSPRKHPEFWRFLSRSASSEAHIPAYAGNLP